jgi:hypothetical protein
MLPTPTGQVSVRFGLGRKAIGKASGEMSDQLATPGIRRQIKEKQDEISNYLSVLEPRGTRLTYLNIICGAAATLLGGGAASALSQDSPPTGSWLIPLLAAICSFVATVAAALSKVQLESRLPLLQKSATRLEGLAALLDANAVSDAEASKRFDGYVQECPPIPRRNQFPFEAVSGTIGEPQDGQPVQATFRAAGTVYNLGRSVTLWLTVEIDDKIWPKEGRVFVDTHGRWSQAVFEDGVNAQVGLSLWAVNVEADRKLQAWLDGGNRTRTFPELRPLPGMKRLARVQNIRIAIARAASSKPGRDRVAEPSAPAERRGI